MSEAAHQVGRPGPWLTGVVALLLVGLVAAGYGDVGRHAFLYCDDDAYVFENPMVRQGLSGPGLSWALLSAHAANWHPLTWLSHMLDVSLFGLDAGRHLLFNAGLHAANTVLLFAFLRRATGALWGSALVAALFACHPLRVESVAWVSERKDVLSGLFFFSTLLAYLGYARRPGTGRYLLALVLFALALLSKPMVVTLPCVLLLLDVWPLDRTPLGWLRLVSEKLPLLALSAATSVLAIASQSGDGAMGDLASLPLVPRIANALTSCVAYLRKAVWPSDLAIFYPHPALVHPEGYDPLGSPVVAAALVLAAVTALALATFRTRPYIAVGWLWYLGMLVPVLGLVQVGEQSMADRYAYLPLVGVQIAVVWLARDLVASRPKLRPGTVPVAALVLFLCLGLTWRQVTRWRDGESVFRHALAVTEDNYFAHNHLGRTYENAGKLELAVAAYEDAIRIRPSAGTLGNLGNALAKSGNTTAAIARFEQAIALDPDSANAHGNLGVVLGMLDRFDSAIAAYERAIALDPEHRAAHYNLGSLLLRRGEIERGTAYLERALALNPFNADAANNLGVAYAEQRRFDDAIAVYTRTLELDPAHAGTRCNLGRTHERAGDLERAAAHYTQAVATDPRCRYGHYFLGYAHFRAGRLDEALAHLEQVLWLDPSSAEAYNDVGSVHAQRRDLEQAALHFQQALRLDPNSAVARKNLERVRAELAADGGGEPALGDGPRE